MVSGNKDPRLEVLAGVICCLTGTVRVWCLPSTFGTPCHVNNINMLQRSPNAVPQRPVQFFRPDAVAPNPDRYERTADSLMSL